jgi:hypothetical protein
MPSEAIAITAVHPIQAAMDAVSSIRTRFQVDSERSRFAVGPYLYSFVAAAILLCVRPKWIEGLEFKVTCRMWQ